MNRPPRYGPQLRQRRLVLGITQRALAKQSGVSANRIGQIEMENSKAGDTIRARLEAALEELSKERNEP